VFLSIEACLSYRIIEKFDDQVEVAVSLTEGEFDQVSGRFCATNFLATLCVF